MSEDKPDAAKRNSIGEPAFIEAFVEALVEALEVAVEMQEAWL